MHGSHGATATAASGLPYCKAISSQEAPLLRSLLAVGRAYVSPATGVGPDANDLLTFHTVLLTPKQLALPVDSQPYVPGKSYKAGNTSPCLQALLGYAQCAGGPGRLCCAAVKQWRDSNCDCSEDGVAIRATLPEIPGEGIVLRQLARRCGLTLRRKRC